MSIPVRLFAAPFIALMLGCPCVLRGQNVSPPLPANVRMVWDTDKAWRESTPTRQRICINGLWLWQPAGADAQNVPTDGWGGFKVPGSWPGISDYLQKDSQTLYPNPAWKDKTFGAVTAAWHQREIETPAEWNGRRITLSLEYLNSFAVVYLDGKKVGEARFPAGEVDLSAVCTPGHKQVLSVLVVALPMKGVMLSYTDSASAREVKGSVARRGLCGDVYLVSTKKGARLAESSVQTSLRKGELTIHSALDDLAPDRQYTLHFDILRDKKIVEQFSSKAFKAGDVSDGRIAVAHAWKPAELWDLNTPHNVNDLRVSLVDADGNLLDTNWPVRFGFRELWIDGRDFVLNGTRIYLCAVPLDNAQIGAAMATYAAARESLERLKRIGINLVYTHNYDCQPGSHLSVEEILRAADDVGMLVSFTQPHFSHYDWKSPDADANNGYARHAAFYAKVAGNHPSVVFYSMSHNATGYDQDMNPDLIDGLHDPRETWSSRNATLALRAQAIVQRLDPSRIVYHHAGGNIGAMHTINFYPNFAPIQELSDWFEHWAAQGAKPAFTCEYGAPFTWDWTMYRGWYQGKREFGSAAVPWEFCLAEWDSQFLGDRAFAISDMEKANLRWEAAQYRAGRVWHRWDYPTQVGSPKFEDRNRVLAMYTADNWRAFRTWGVSGISPWEYEMFWVPRPRVDRGRKELSVDWDHLQRPGFSPDYIDRPFERIDTSFDYSDWIPTAAGEALLRNNQPVLAYIGGKKDAFTSKDHNFRAGEIVEKQLILINNSRQRVQFQCDWSLTLPVPISGRQQVTVETGQQARIPLRFELPATLAPGRYTLSATARFGADENQTDSFAIDVLPVAAPVAPPGGIVLFDTVGQTSALLEKLGISFRRLDAGGQVGPDEILVIGKLALSLDGAGPDLSRVADGMKVIVFEQSSEALEKRLGFRVVEYGLREVFPRVPDHPLLAGIDPEYLRDWQGEATTVPPRLTFQTKPMHGPIVQWCDIPVTRVWRCGNRGNVASVLIEKPARGNFLPILDGGYSLQYSPLMEFDQGKGMVLFCQLDLTGRSESDPAAETLAQNILHYPQQWKPQAQYQAVCLGSAAGKAYLKAAGVNALDYQGEELSRDRVLILAGDDPNLTRYSQAIQTFVQNGGRLLAIDVNQAALDAILPFKVTVHGAEHINAVFDPPGRQSPLAGVGPADLLIRSPRELSLVSGGAMIIGDGVIALAPPDSKTPNVIVCQLAPWQFSYQHEYNLKRTYRRTAFLLARLLGNLGVGSQTPLLERFGSPPRAADEKRWLDGLYLDVPEEWDDPYRFFRW